MFLTTLENISQWEGLSRILWKKMFEIANQTDYVLVIFGMIRGERFLTLGLADQMERHQLKRQ